MKDLSADIQITELEIKKSKYDLDVFALEEYMQEKDALLVKATDMYKALQNLAKETNQTIHYIKMMAQQKNPNKTALEIVKKIKKKNKYLLEGLPKTEKFGEALLEVLGVVENLKTTTDFSNKIDIERVTLKAAQRYAASPNYETRQLLIENQAVKN